MPSSDCQTWQPDRSRPDRDRGDLDGPSYTTPWDTILGGGLPHFRPSLDLYLTFDGPAFGRDPIADTVTVGEIALAGPDSVSAEKIFEQTSWDERRFNPAFEHVASQIPDGRVSKSYGTKFTVPFFHMLAEDRVRLKRFVANLKG